MIMRNKFSLAAACLLVITTISAQSLTADAWRQDLKFLQHTVHAKYPNLFYSVTASQWDSAVNVLDKKIGTLSDVQMKVEFAKLVAMFKIGHTAVRRQSGEGANFNSWVRNLPVRFYLFDDGLYIKAIHADYKDAAGGKVIRIGNKKADEAMTLIRPVISYENEQGFKNMLQYYLNAAEILQVTGITEQADKIPVTYLKDGKEKTILITAETPVQGPRHGPINESAWIDAYDKMNKPGAVLWLKEPQRLRYFEYLPATKTVYVRHSGVQDEPNETIKDFFEKVFDFVDKNDVDKFVLDIRLNGGGNNYLNKPVITGLVQSKKINKKGHLFVVLGKATFSAAQNLTNELEKYTECIFVGEPTSENVNFFGDTRTEILPNSKLNIALSWLWWQNLDPRDKRPWTAPRLATGITFSDYQKGVDPAFNAIIDYDPKNSVENQLQELVEKGKYEEATSLAKKYIANPLYRYYSNELETQLNNLGYEMINKQKPEDAVKIFHMNVQLFPESPNVYDSYAESLWKTGKHAEAVKFYELAISKDQPGGPTAENAKRMLEQIKKGF
jgi:tetratricopeptide (TPR) repeat protein